jgi:hypothetical protein
MGGTMKTSFAVAIAVAVLGFAAPASADTIANFTLDNVTFSDGGTATGGFTLDLTTSTLSNVDITTSLDYPFGGTYTGGSGFVGTTSFTNNPASFEFDFPAFLYESVLEINLAGGLTAADLTGSNSFSIASGSEAAYFIGCDGPGFYCGSRSIVSGSLDTGISATPLPATLPLFAGGLGFVGYLTGRKKRKANQTLAA